MDAKSSGSLSQVLGCINMTPDGLIAEKLKRQLRFWFGGLVYKVLH